MAEVVVVGNAGVDTNVYLRGPAIDFSVEANFTENTDGVGQAGGYASRGYARLGYTTAFIGHTGVDAAGTMVREVLTRDGIDLSGMGVDPLGTARSVNLMFSDGSRKNFYDGKGHMGLRADLAAARRVLTGARLAHVNIPNWARDLLPLCRELGATIACDLQDVIDVNDPYRGDFIAGADILFFSAANHPDPRPIIDRFFALSSATLIVAGMGKNGAALATRDRYLVQPPPPLDWPVVDTNGAGDSLAAGFLASHVLDGRTLEESLLRGQIAARWCCTQRGSETVLISRTELERVASSFR